MVRTSSDKTFNVLPGQCGSSNGLNRSRWSPVPCRVAILVAASKLSVVEVWVRLLPGGPAPTRPRNAASLLEPVLFGRCGVPMRPGPRQCEASVRTTTATTLPVGLRVGVAVSSCHPGSWGGGGTGSIALPTEEGSVVQAENQRTINGPARRGPSYQAPRFRSRSSPAASTTCTSTSSTR
jgi:hypothetical protein